MSSIPKPSSHSYALTHWRALRPDITDGKLPFSWLLDKIKSLSAQHETAGALCPLSLSQGQHELGWIIFPTPL